jgi:hypothetical protein
VQFEIAKLRVPGLAHLAVKLACGERARQFITVDAGKNPQFEARQRAGSLAYPLGQPPVRGRARALQRCAQVGRGRGGRGRGLEPGSLAPSGG